MQMLRHANAQQRYCQENANPRQKKQRTKYRTFSLRLPEMLARPKNCKSVPFLNHCVSPSPLLRDVVLPWKLLVHI